MWSSQFTVPYISFILAWHSYLHISSLIILMQSDFLNPYPYKQTKVETDIYPIWDVSFVTWPLLDISSLMHSWFILHPWSTLVHNQALLIHVKQATIEIDPNSLAHVSFAICQICLLSHDMISHNIEDISLILIALLSFARTRLFL